MGKRESDTSATFAPPRGRSAASETTPAQTTTEQTAGAEPEPPREQAAPQHEQAAPPREQAPPEPDDGTVEVRLELASYVQLVRVDGREESVPRRRGDVFRVSRQEVERIPFAFKSLAAIEQDKHQRERPRQDRAFDKVRQAAVDALASLEESHQLAALEEVAAAREAAKAIGAPGV